MATRKRRRTNGEGTVFQRGNRWVASATLGFDEDGKQKRLTRSGRTASEARNNLDKARAQLTSPHFGDPTTVTELIDRWLEDIVRHRVAARAYES
jgi:hypothetical protein